MVYVTGVHLEGGTRPEHIASVWWLDDSNGTSNTMTTAQAVDFIDKGNAVRVGGPTTPVTVRVVRPQNGKPYLRTSPDNTPSDNLLNLPKF